MGYDRDLVLSPIQKALVALVFAGRPEDLSRSRLIATLWEESATALTRHRLSQLLYATARRLDSSALFVADAHSISPNIRCLESDVTELDRLLAAGSLRAAMAIVRKGFLPHLSDALGDAFDDWREARGASFLQRLKRQAVSAWAASEAAGDWPAAYEAAEVLQELEPKSPAYLEFVMRSAMHLGQRSRAGLIRDAWAREIQLSSMLPESGEEISPPSEEHGNAAIVGRDEECRVILRALRSAPQGVVSSVVVTGEGGIGKTSLAREVCRAITREGTVVLRARCSALEQQLPLNVLADVFQDPAAAPLISSLPQSLRDSLCTLTSGRQPGPEGGGDVDPSLVTRQMFADIHSALQSIGAKRAVLWLDDSQWIDQTTTAALAFAARRWAAGTLILLLTARTADSARRLHAAASLIPIATIELGPLTEAHARTLATGVVGRSLRREEERLLFRVTGRVPLFLLELAHEWARGRQADAAALSPVSPTVEQIIDQRMATLGDLDRRCLELVAVAEGIALPVLRELLSADPLLLADALARLIDERLVAQTGADVAVTHELLRQGICHRIAAPKRQLLHGVVARSLCRGGSGLDYGRAAMHFQQASERRNAYEFACLGAAAAEGAGGFGEAARLMAIARANSAAPEEATQLLEREATVRYRGADFEGAFPLLTTIASDRRADGALDEGMRWSIRRLHAGIEIGALRTSEALRELDDLIESCRLNGSWECYVEGTECRLRILERENRTGELRETVEGLRDMPQGLSVREKCLWHAARALGIVFSDGDGSLNDAEKAYGCALSPGIGDLRDRCLHRLMFVHFVGGTMDMTDGRQLLEERLRRPMAVDSLKGRYGFLEAAGLWHVEAGEYDVADVFLAQAEEILDPVADLADKVHMLANRGEQLAAAGDVVGARDYFGLAHNALHQHHHWRAHQVVLGGLGYCGLELGDLRLAHRCEEQLEYRDESYFDPWIIVLFRATLIRRRASELVAADYLSDVRAKFAGRMRTVAMKLALLEGGLRRERDRRRAREVLGWVLDEASSLKLTHRADRARALLGSIAGM